MHSDKQSTPIIFINTNVKKTGIFEFLQKICVRSKHKASGVYFAKAHCIINNYLFIDYN